MTRLLQTSWTCPVCGRPLDELGGEVIAEPAPGTEAWRTNVTRQTISCDDGHTFEARYEQVRPWLSRLAGVGDQVV